MKSFAPCFSVAVVEELLIHRGASHAYSPSILALLFVAWAVGSMLLAWFEPRLRFVYFGSLAVLAPVISYSMLGYGLLEMGGFLQALCGAAAVLPFHKLFQNIRARRKL